MSVCGLATCADARLPSPAPPAVQGAAGAALQRLAQDGLAWVPTCCNLATLLCFGLCLALNFQVRGGPQAAGRRARARAALWSLGFAWVCARA